MILLLSSRLATALQIGETVGPVTFETIDGYTRTMDNYGDRPGTVVVFLSARSDATLHQLPAIQAVHRKYRTDDVLFVGVCSAAEEKGDELRTFAQRTGLIFPVHRDLSGQVAKRFGATATPEFFLIDRRGVLVYRGGLGDREEGLEEAIVELLVDTPVRHTVSSLRGDPIGPNGKRREIPDPYGSMAFSSELVFTTIDGVPAHHCSTIAEAPSGDLLCLWYAGSYESADDQALYLARLPKGTRKWTRPQRLIWDPQQPPGNAVIFRQPDGRVAIVWGRMEGSRPTRRGSGWETCRLMIRTSDDDGQRWSTDRELPNTFGYLPRNIPVTLPDGRIALPITGEAGRRRGGFLLFRSRDGKQWTRGGTMLGGSQPTVIVRDNGELLSLLRHHPRIMTSISSDGGLHWSTSRRTELKNPGSGIAMTKLRPASTAGPIHAGGSARPPSKAGADRSGGRIVLVFNNTDESDRTPLCLLQSTDDGQTWHGLRRLESDWGEFSYPCILQTSDGKIHISYTYRRYSIKHVTFDEGWLTHEQRPN